MEAVAIVDVPLEYAWCAWCKMTASNESPQKLSEQLVVAACEHEDFFTLGLCNSHFETLKAHVESRTLFCAGKAHPIADMVSRPITTVQSDA